MLPWMHAALFWQSGGVAHTPPLHCLPPPQAVKSGLVMHAPPLHCRQTAQLPHEPPQPSSPQLFPVQFLVQPAAAPACWALCFLAFLRHFFFFSPDFFLHFARKSWASLGPDSRQPRKPPSADPARSRSAPRREGFVARERSRVSKRSASKIGSFSAWHGRSIPSTMTTLSQSHYPQNWGWTGHDLMSAVSSETPSCRGSWSRVPGGRSAGQEERRPLRTARAVAAEREETPSLARMAAT